MSSRKKKHRNKFFPLALIPTLNNYAKCNSHHHIGAVKIHSKNCSSPTFKRREKSERQSQKILFYSQKAIGISRGVFSNQVWGREGFS